ncbi:MAG: universal stress protein [Thermodesulfovibrionales bacterium]
MEFKKIIYATDFSESSQQAAPYAAELARRYGARVFVVHVLYDIERAAGWYVPHASTDALYADMEKEAEKQLHRAVAEDLRGYGQVEYVVLRGIPDEEIVAFATEQGADLIVMSTHGRRGIDRVLFGSTSEKVVRQARCPVLTVRPGK